MGPNHNKTKTNKTQPITATIWVLPPMAEANIDLVKEADTGIEEKKDPNMLLAP